MHDDQKTSDYPPGYTPIPIEELEMAVDPQFFKARYRGIPRNYPHLQIAAARRVERAVLARLPKPDAEPVRWIVRTVSKRGVKTEDCVNFLPSDALIGYVTQRDGVPPEVIPLYTHPPQDTAEREPIVWLCKTEFGEGISYSNKFWECHPDFYQGAQEKRPTDERDALVRRIDTEWLAEIIPDDLESLLRDIRANLVGGGK